jgi:hypothetical protein
MESLAPLAAVEPEAGLANAPMSLENTAAPTKANLIASLSFISSDFC